MSRSRAARSAAANKDEADEERTIWNQLKIEAKRVDEMVATSNAKWDRMCELHTEINSRSARGISPSSSIEDELGDLARDNIKLIEDIRSATEGDRDDNTLSIMRSIEVLGALRSSSEADAVVIGSRGSGLNPPSNSIQIKDRKRANSKIPGSPLVNIKSEGRAASRASSRQAAGANRMGSASSARETSRSEEGADPDGLRLIDVYQKIPLVVGTEVLYRLNTSTRNTRHGGPSDTRFGDKADTSGPGERDPSALLDGEGILCSITAILGGEGKNRRYEIRDSDPDPSTPPHPYKATSSQLVPIPNSNEGMPFLENGTNVLALYPGTTTFYKAEVVVPAGPAGAKHARQNAGVVRLRFEGEDEADKEEEVERRYVIPEN